MNAKRFLADALGAALETGVATSEDIVRHCTPDVLANHLPRPLWARLITACLGAGRVDAQLVVETVGVPNLAEHVPVAILWACVAELGSRALSGAELAPPSAWSSAARPSTPAPLSLAPPPDAKPSTIPPPVVTPAPAMAPIPSPLADLVAELDAADPVASPPPPTNVVAPATSRTRSTTRQPFRSSTTAVGGGRRPQASAPTTPAQVASAASVMEGGTTRARNRLSTDADYEIETDVRDASDYRAGAHTEAEEALVDWPASEETVTGGPDYDRKR